MTAKRKSAAKPRKPKRGVCRVCGCIEQKGCRDVDGLPCSWVNRAEDLCSKCSREMINPRSNAQREILARVLADSGPEVQMLLLGEIVEHLIDRDRRRNFAEPFF